MFRMFLIVLISLSTFPLFSQIITEPLPLRSNLLSHSQLLPEDLQLFSQDTVSQVLFNPARAAAFNKSFLFFNYLPSPEPGYVYVSIPVDLMKEVGEYPLNSPASTNFSPFENSQYFGGRAPSFSLASLFNFAGEKWLFTVDNRSSRSKVEQVNDNGNNFSNPRSQDTYNYRSSLYNSSARLSYVKQGGWGNFSLGVYFILNYLDGDRVQRYSSSSFYAYNYPDGNYSSRTDRYFRSSDIIQNVKQYNYGIEFALSKNKLDYLFRLSYQKGDMNFNQISSSDQFNYDSLYENNAWNVNHSNSNSLFVEESGFSPYTINLENFLSYNLPVITPEDNIFISARAFTSKGDHPSFVSFVERNYYTPDSSSEYHGGNSFNSDINDWGIDAAAGYVLRKSFSDLFILSGIDVFASYRRNEDIAYSSNYSSDHYDIYNNYRNRYFTASFLLPVYINYSPAAWVSLIGGLNYYYTITNFDYVRTSVPLVISGFPSSNSQIISVDNNTKAFNSFSENFLGLILKHPSGFQVQVAFNRDFNEMTYWNLSAGYIF